MLDVHCSTRVPFYIAKMSSSFVSKMKNLLGMKAWGDCSDLKDELKDEDEDEDKDKDKETNVAKRPAAEKKASKQPLHKKPAGLKRGGSVLKRPAAAKGGDKQKENRSRDRGGNNGK